jgi:hypothetical protein
MPFVREDGSLTGLCSEIADYLAGMEMTDAFWANVAADQLRTILDQRIVVRELNEIIVRQRVVIDRLKAAAEPGVFA